MNLTTADLLNLQSACRTSAMLKKPSWKTALDDLSVRISAEVTRRDEAKAKTGEPMDG